MAINQILPFGTVPGANVLAPADYQALAARLGGFSAGVAKSKELNTVWRQASFVAAMIGQYIADKAGQDVLDDGDLAALQAKFVAALAASPAFTGEPTAPTPGTTDNSAKLATTAFVRSAMALTLPPGTIQWFSMQAAPSSWLKANGAAVSVTTYAALAANIYCGDALNPTALFGYRCTDSSNPSTTRSTTGGFIVLPDLRGEFIRGWDDGRGIDVGRTFGTAQGSMYANHSHLQQATSGTGGGLTAISFGSTTAAVTSASNVPTVTSGGSETRPRNVALLACIKY